MGMHAYTDNVYIGGYRSITDLADEFDVPAPRQGADEYSLELNASEVREWVERASAIYEGRWSPLTKTDAYGRSMRELAFTFYHVAQLMGSDAERYIGSVNSDLDQFDWIDAKTEGKKPMSRNKRRDLLRKATKDYRLVWS